jgi:hypothetical protein
MKSKVCFIIFIFYFVLFNFSCRKITNTTTVSGRVYNVVNDKGVKAIFNIYREDPECLTCQATEIQKVETDNEGFYRANIRPSGKWSYFVGANSFPLYTPASGHIYIDKRSNNKDVNIGLSPLSWITLHVRNNKTQSDYISIHGLDNSGGIVITGDIIDQIIGPYPRYTQIGNAFSYTIYENLTPHTYPFTITINSFDTTYYNLDF